MKTGEKVKKLALCGVLCALGVVVMLFGGVIPIAVYCCPALAAMLLVPIDCECGTKYGLTAYAAVAVLSVLLVADKETAAVFVFLGYYPVVKKFFDRIRPKVLRIVLKLLLFNVSAVVLYVLLIFVFNMTALVEEFRTTGTLLLIATLALGNIAFILLDFCLARLHILYFVKLRKYVFKNGK